MPRKLLTHVHTVGELRRLLEPFTDECPLAIDRQETGESESVMVEYDIEPDTGGRIIVS
jgi:hypothetical protein